MQPLSVRPSLAATVGRLDPHQGYLHKWPFASVPLAAAQMKWDPPPDSYWLERRRGFLHSVCRSVRSATPITLTFKSLGSDGARARERWREREQNENTGARKDVARSHAFAYTSKQTGSYFMLLILYTNTGGAQCFLARTLLILVLKMNAGHSPTPQSG